METSKSLHAEMKGVRKQTSKYTPIFIVSSDSTSQHSNSFLSENCLHDTDTCLVRQKLGNESDPVIQVVAKKDQSSSLTVPPPPAAKAPKPPKQKSLPEYKHLCKFCRESFPVLYLLNYHMKTRHRHQCNQCRRMFSGGIRLASHQAYTHFRPRPCTSVHATSISGAKPTQSEPCTCKRRKSKPSHICQLCSRRFKSPGLLTKHRCNPRFVLCVACGTYFGSLLLFRNHKERCSNAWKAIANTVGQDGSQVNESTRQTANPVSEPLASKDSEGLKHSSS